MKKPKKQTFHIYATIAIETSIEIPAASLEDAVEESKKLKVGDYIEFHGEHINNVMRVTGVYEDYKDLNI